MRQNSIESESHGRSLSKAISWRIIGTLDTITDFLVVDRNFNRGLNNRFS